MLEKRPAALGTTEHIEMEIFASEESRAVVSVHDTEEGYFGYYVSVSVLCLNSPFFFQCSDKQFDMLSVRA